MSNNVCPSCGHELPVKSNTCPYCGCRLFFADEQSVISEPEEEMQEKSEMIINAQRRKKPFGIRYLTYDIFTVDGKKLCTLQPGEEEYIPITKPIEIYAVPAFASNFMKKIRKTTPVKVLPGKTSFVSLVYHKILFGLRAKAVIINLTDKTNSKVR